MFFKSIRFKALFWYTFILTITLLIFSFILYEGFRKTLYDDFDDLLSSRCEGVADSINAYWRAGAAEKDAFAFAAQAWVTEKRKDPDLMSIFVRILDANGSLIVASKSMPNISQLPKEDFKDIIDGDDSFDTVKGEFADGRKMRARMYSRPVYEHGKVAYVVQVAGPIGLMSLVLHNLIFILFVMLPLTVILAAFPGVLLVRLTLKPVDTMINTLRQITAENLKLKIHIPDTKDEIKKLADTFNEMIERIDRSFTSQQRFIQDISHELRTPLSALKTDIEAAIKNINSRKESEAVLLRMLKEADAFSRIVDNLSTLSRFETDQVTLEIKKINLTKLIEGAVDNMRSLAGRKGIDISFYCDETVIMDADEIQLGRMMMNLLDNAIRYTYRKGKVTVTLVKDDKFAKIKISDTGMGMPEEEFPYIFDRFYQVVKTRGSGDNFGIGLSIVKAVVEAHKGDISVESKRGQGSTFTVTLLLSYPA
ncbi:MAG: HAMP domain-containing sensor histidine kinase [Candidatus Omnitrophota bacterium]|jgi:signal transduction histidine kinase